MKRIISICILAALAATARAEVYPRTFVVIDADRAADVLTLEDGAGMAWKVYGAEDWRPGDIAAAILEDNGTEEITDDTIVSLRYSGTVETFTR